MQQLEQLLKEVLPAQVRRAGRGWAGSGRGHEGAAPARLLSCQGGRGGREQNDTRNGDGTSPGVSCRPVQREALPEPSLQSGGPREFDLEVLAGFLSKLSEFDARMNQVVVDSGILQGAGLAPRRWARARTGTGTGTGCVGGWMGWGRAFWGSVATPEHTATPSPAGLEMAEVEAAAARVPLQTGCREALAQALSVGIPARVLSVNWSARFVQAALGLPAASSDGCARAHVRARPAHRRPPRAHGSGC